MDLEKKMQKKLQSIRSGSFKVKVPKSVDLKIIGCICGKDSEAWALLKKDGTFETTCPNCVRVYYEGIYSINTYENKITFNDIPYDFSAKDLIPLNSFNIYQPKGSVKFEFLNVFRKKK